MFDTVEARYGKDLAPSRQGDCAGRERLLGGVREDRRPERRRASGVARVQGRVRRAARLREGRAEGRAGPVDGAPRSDGGRRGQGALIGSPKRETPGIRLSLSGRFAACLSTRPGESQYSSVVRRFSCRSAHHRLAISSRWSFDDAPHEPGGTSMRTSTSHSHGLLPNEYACAASLSRTRCGYLGACFKH